MDSSPCLLSWTRSKQHTNKRQCPPGGPDRRRHAHRATQSASQLPKQIRGLTGPVREGPRSLLGIEVLVAATCGDGASRPVSRRLKSGCRLLPVTHWRQAPGPSAQTAGTGPPQLGRGRLQGPDAAALHAAGFTPPPHLRRRIHAAAFTLTAPDTFTLTHSR